METLVHADLFFIITGIAIIIITLFLIVVLAYIIVILRDMYEIIQKIKAEGQEIAQDIVSFRALIRQPKSLIVYVAKGIVEGLKNK